jgi:hypothetical protein
VTSPAATASARAAMADSASRVAAGEVSADAAAEAMLARLRR